jgi:hypothetical protein
MNRLLLLSACWFAGLAVGSAQSSNSMQLWRAHAHNDYHHARPLAEALAHGFRSVEADIWLTNGVLLVAHDFRDTSPEKTLESLYLNPLRAFFRTNSWRGGAPSLTLLIDVKSDAEKTYAVLGQVLQRYADILTRFESNTIQTNAVTAIISGARAEVMMRAEKVRFAAIDGRLGDLDVNPPLALVPLVSDNWTKHFLWRGVGVMSNEEREKLRQLVKRTHAQGRRLRLWAAPDNEAGWRELFEAGVDFLNTDKLADLERFLRAQEPKLTE